MDSNRAGEFDFPLVNENAPSTPVYRLHGLNYSPYIGAGENPNWGDDQITDEELADRLALVAPYTDGSAPSAVTTICGKQASSRTPSGSGGRRRLAGPEDTPQGQQANRNQIDCLKQLLQAGQVDIAIVGSEVLYRGNLSADQLIAYINEVKQFVVQEGLSVPVTTADTYGVLLANDSVVAAVDLVMANYYPYWEGHKLA